MLIYVDKIKWLIRESDNLFSCGNFLRIRKAHSVRNNAWKSKLQLPNLNCERYNLTNS